MTVLIKGSVSVDDRGSVRFVNDFNPSQYNVKRFYQVTNVRPGYIRAFHGHMHETKFAYVPSGSALLGICKIIVNSDGTLELDSPQKYVLSSESPSVLIIPKGYANGFKSLTENTTIMFFSDANLADTLIDDYRFKYDLTEKHKQFWEEDFR